MPTGQNYGADPALAKAEPVARLGPSGFDPGEGAFAFGDRVFPGLAKLVEECGEVVQVAGKLMMVHGDRAHWSGDLRAALIEELADCRAATTFVIIHNLTGEERLRLIERENAKLKKFFEWHADFDADPPPPLARIVTRQGGDAKQAPGEALEPDQLQPPPSTDSTP